MGLEGNGGRNPWRRRKGIHDDHLLSCDPNNCHSVGTLSSHGSWDLQFNNQTTLEG